MATMPWFIYVGSSFVLVVWVSYDVQNDHQSAKPVSA